MGADVAQAVVENVVAVVGVSQEDKVELARFRAADGQAEGVAGRAETKEAVQALDGEVVAVAQKNDAPEPGLECLHDAPGVPARFVGLVAELVMDGSMDAIEAIQVRAGWSV